MAFDFTPFENGEAIQSAEITSRFDSIEAEINDLEVTSIQPKSLDHNHLPSTVLFSESINLAGQDEASSTSITAGSGLHYYNNYHPGTLSVNSAVLGARYPEGWAEIREGGQYSTSHTTQGTGQALQIDFDQPYEVGVDGVGGILIMANIFVEDLADITKTYKGTEFLGIFIIQVYRSNPAVAQWTNLTWTERYVNSDTKDQAVGTSETARVAQKEVAIRTLLPKAVWLGPIDKVRVLCAVRGKGGGYFSAMTLQNCNLSVMVFHGYER